MHAHHITAQHIKHNWVADDDRVGDDLDDVIVDDVDDYYDPNPCRRFIQGAEGESGYPGGSV
jgi:hypothetical protein